jgi:hypothetical protein
MTCRERSGFLFAHTCDQLVVGSCSRCQKEICRRHQRELEGSALCVSCYKEARGPQQDPLAHVRDRGYYAYFDDPFWYVHYHRDNYPYYDARDYAAFDRPRGAAKGLEVEQDPDAS